MEKSKEVKQQIADEEKNSDELNNQRNAKLNLIGNILGDAVPRFKDEEHNEVVRTWG